MANSIKALNLSYDTDGNRDSSTGRLAHAVYNAWLAGILPVVAAGNTGSALPNPGSFAYALKVGATDLHGTTGRGDETMATFKGCRRACWPRGGRSSRCATRARTPR